MNCSEHINSSRGVSTNSTFIWSKNFRFRALDTPNHAHPRPLIRLRVSGWPLAQRIKQPSVIQVGHDSGKSSLACWPARTNAIFMTQSRSAELSYYEEYKEPWTTLSKTYMLASKVSDIRRIQQFKVAGVLAHHPRKQTKPVYFWQWHKGSTD